MIKGIVVCMFDVKGLTMNKRKYITPLVIFVVVMIVFMARLFQWQFIDGEHYQAQAISSGSYYIKLNASRGEILDRNGNALAQSRTVYNVVVNALTMDSDRNDALEFLIGLLDERGIEPIDNFPIELSEVGFYKFVEDRESDIKYLTEDLLGLEEEASADECMELIIERYDLEDYPKAIVRDMASIRFGMTKAQFSVSSPYLIAEDIDMETVQIIEEESLNMPGVEIRLSTKREYEDGTIAPHIIGSIGSITQEQYDLFVENDNTYSSSNVSGYAYNDKLGQSGIESAFEEELRGENGKQEIITDIDGKMHAADITVHPKAGNNIYLTIDSTLQSVLNNSLARNVEAAEPEEAIAGAAVVLDIETFGVLAASTYPSFDIKQYTTDSGYYNNLLEDETLPLFNRAFNGAFTPGSILKPIVGLGALEEGVITENTHIYCNHTYSFYETDPLACIGIHGVGNVGFFEAMASSCNSYFADAGRLLGIEKMEVYANLFGLGEKTGIEISETLGGMTNPTDYRAIHGVEWVDGVTVHASIGQADSVFSPLQLATYTATIANDGVRLETHLMHKITEFDNNKVIEDYEPVVVDEIPVDPHNIDLIQSAMRDVITSGTARRNFSDYPIAIAGKTGTAQNNNKPDSSTFIAYAPYDDPKIAIAVVLEYADSSTLTQNVAKDILNYYFYGIVPE